MSWWGPFCVLHSQRPLRKKLHKLSSSQLSLAPTCSCYLFSLPKGKTHKDFKLTDSVEAREYLLECLNENLSAEERAR